MNRHEDDTISQWMNRTHPPEVAPEEWDSIYRGILLSAARAGERKHRRSSTVLRWAVAASFLVGVALGILLSRAPASSVQPVDNKGTVDRTSLPWEGSSIVPTGDFEPMMASSEPEGVDMFGLKNVRIESQSPEIMGARFCQMSGETPRGVKVVWNYIAQENQDINIGG